MLNNLDYYVNNLEVLYEDNHLLVINKYENVLSQKDITNDIDINEIAKEYLKRKYNKPGNVYLGLVHRLDRRCGGVMVLAKTSKCASRLSIDIQNHNFKKLYLVKCEGIIKSDGEINIKLKKENNKAIVCKDGLDSKLEYHVLFNDKKYTYLLVDLKTGRYNQIRASFAYINHPLYGDYKYGAQKENRLGLWCYQMVINHPVTKEEINIKKIPSGDLWGNIEKYL